MDMKKTGSSTESIIQFIDGHEPRASAFGDNRAADRLYRKAERVVAAAHVLTAHLPVQEPLRKDIRTVSVALLPTLLEMRDDMRAVQSPRTQEFETKIRHLVSLVRLAAVSSFISFQNADLVCEALDDLVYFLHASQKTAYSESIRLSKELFTDVRTQSIKVESSTSGALREKMQKTDSVHEESIKKDIVSRVSLSSEKPSVRAEQIMSILRSQPKLSIRDVAAQLPEYSEKMIQRELADLVQSGKVRKEGEKRWSTYSVA